MRAGVCCASECPARLGSVPQGQVVDVARGSQHTARGVEDLGQGSAGERGHRRPAGE